MADGSSFPRFEALLSGARLGQFISVGAVGALLDTATVLVLTTQLGVYRGYAKLAAAELAIVFMFVVNEHWTFAQEGEEGLRPFLRRLGKSNVVRLGGLAVGTVVFVVVSGFDVTLPVGGEALWLTVANGVGIGAGFFVNYTAESLVTWRVGREGG